MASDTLYTESWQGIRKSAEAGRLAHAYIIVGSPRGMALEFAEEFLKLLFCENTEKPCNSCIGCRQVDAHKHVDTLWIEPQSKARQIKAADIRGLVRKMGQTSFEGGWKAGIILAADCMNVSSANILLKTLEEPPPRTALLLVTDSPQSLLPTILSRCQEIVLPTGRSEKVDAIWKDPLMEILKVLPPASGLEASRVASRLKALFDDVKADISETVAGSLEQEEEALDESKLKVILEARTSSLLKEIQADVLRFMLDWHRDVLMCVSGVKVEHLLFSEQGKVLENQATRHTPATALMATQQVEIMGRRLDRNIPALQVFDEAFRKMIRA
jgi:DNA polymerase-3 subunit delta'